MLTSRYVRQQARTCANAMRASSSIFSSLLQQGGAGAGVRSWLHSQCLRFNSLLPPCRLQQQRQRGEDAVQQCAEAAPRT